MITSVHWHGMAVGVNCVQEVFYLIESVRMPRVGLGTAVSILVVLAVTLPPDVRDPGHS